MLSWGAIGAVVGDERQRWPLWIPVGLGLGIAVYFALAAEPPLWVGGVTAASALAALGLLRRTGRPAALLSFAATAVLVMALGFTAAQVRTATVAAPVLASPTGAVRVAGEVESVEMRTDGIRLVLVGVSIDGTRTERTPDRVRIRFRGDQWAVRAGDRVVARAVLMPPPAPSLPGGFDFQRQSFFHGLGAVGYGLGAVEATSRGEAGNAGTMTRLRSVAIARIERHLDGDTAAVAIALITGERGAIAEPVMDAIRDSGLAHLLAISGMNISVVAGVLFVGLRAAFSLVPAIALTYPVKKWAAVIAVFGAGAYTLFTGATVPTQRAFLMIALVFVGVLVDRRALSMRLVAWAAAAILLVAPENLLSASFQLSFAAVVALIAVYETGKLIPAERSGSGEWPRQALLFLSGVALTTIVASAATTPYVVYHFSRVAAYGLAANLVAVPIITLWVTPWTIVVFVLMPFGLEGLALIPMSWGIDAMIRIGEAVAGWPGAVSLIPPLPTWGLGAVTFGGLWLCLWQSWWRWLGSLGLAAGVAAVVIAAPVDVLVSDTGELIAVRTADGGLALSSRRAQRFQRDAWLQNAAIGEATATPPPVWPAAGVSADGRLACDPLGCLYRQGSRQVAFIRAPEAALDDCTVADVVVATVRLPPGCRPAVRVIDRRDLRDGGVHAIRLGDAAVRIDSVNARRGDRPWVVRPDREEQRRPPPLAADGPDLAPAPDQ